MLGSTLIRWVGGTTDDDNGGGCALGMARIAVTGRLGADLKILDTWPWLFQKQHGLVLPCGCQGAELIGSSNGRHSIAYICRSYSGILVHLFNYHVMMVKDWTLEQVCDWVRTYEPVEVEPEIEQTPESVKETI